jgi:flagellar basal-body rod protein FlgB
MQILFDRTSQLLGQMIAGTALRHRVLAANLANAETPGYQAKDVAFSAVLDEAQRRGPAEIAPAPTIKATAVHDTETAARRDGNTVDLDRQMVKLAQNTQWHNAMVQILAGRLAGLKSAIRDRG